MTSTNTSKKKPLILVVEDDHFYSNIYRVKLSKEGYAVALASNGEWALELAKKNKPSLILLDLVMPKLDGFETLKRFKKNKELSSVPVIVLTNLGKDSDKEQAHSLGAKEYLVKASISIQSVVETIKKYV